MSSLIKAVWKYPIDRPGKQTINVRAFSTVLCAKWQDSHYGKGANLYLLVTPNDPTEPYKELEIHVVATGEKVPERCDYVDTIELGNGLIYHVFVKR